MRLFHKFLIPFLFLALAPLIFIGLIVVRDMEKTLHQAALSFQEQAARQAAAEVENYFDNIQSLLNIARQTPQLTQAGARPEVLNTVLSYHPAIMQAAVFGADRQLRHSVTRMRKQPLFALPDLSDWTQKIQTHGFYIGPLDNTSDAVPSVLAGVPIEDPYAAPPGYFLSKINLQGLSLRLQGMDLGTGGRVLLFDQNHELAAHSTAENLFAHQKILPQNVLSSQWTSGTYQDQNNSLSLGVKARLRHLPWFVIFDQPKDQVFLITNAFQKRMLKLFVITGLVSIVLCLGVTQRFVVWPLKKIQEAVRDMVQGRFAVSPPTQLKDEIGALSQDIQQAQQSAQKKERLAAIGLFIRRIGHELKEPLRNIDQALKLIQRRVPQAHDTAQKYFDLMQEEIDRGLDEVEGIQTLGREGPWELSHVSLNALIEQVYQRTHISSAIHVVWQLDQNLPKILLNLRGAAGAVGNALRNAKDALGENGKITIATFAYPRWVVAQVCDNGCGIAAEELNKIFNDDYTTKTQGNGLGMAIIKNAMDRHQGHVKIQSEKNKGTTIELFFPHKKGEQRV